MRRALLWSVRALTIGLGARVALLCAAYFLGSPDVRRYQVESAAVAFIVVGTLLHVALGRNPSLERRTTTRLTGEWAIWCAASLVLYWPSLWVGPLSDDFVLIDRVQQGEFGLVHSEFFRPLPLLAWSGVLQLHGGPVGLHGLNILAHGFVAFLASRLAAPLAMSRWGTFAAGLLVLTFPAAVEAVTWTSGVFDVTATLLILVAVLIARRQAVHAERSTRVAMLLCAITALLCKETAIVAPALIALDAWASGRWSRALLFDIVGLGVVFAGVGIVRLVFASEMVQQPLTKYLLQRWLFGTAGGLAVPWHGQVSGTWPWVPVAGVSLTVGMAAFFFVTRSTAGTMRAVMASAAWLLLGSVPAVTFFFVAPDLQGSRYLYLPAVGYALLLATMVSQTGSAAGRRFGAAAIAVLVLIGAIGTRAHQRYWQDAAVARDVLMRVARTDSRLRSCGTVSVRGLPDTVEGAYVFRNGADLAFASAGLTLSGAAAPPCAFNWDMGRAAFVVVP